MTELLDLTITSSGHPVLYGLVSKPVLVASFDFLNKPYRVILSWADFTHRPQSAMSGDGLHRHTGCWEVVTGFYGV